MLDDNYYIILNKYYKLRSYCYISIRIITAIFIPIGMFTQEKNEIVQERINLIKQLIEAEDHFMGPDLVQFVTDHRGQKVWTHPYRHYSALRIYLALTCFDILGQPDEWLPFPAWLDCNKNKKVVKERDEIFKRHSDKGFGVAIKEVFKDYNEIYGVKNSFYRFLREIISPENKSLLMDSIQLTRVEYHKDIPAAAPNGYRIEDVPTSVKEKFLYDARNAFTHKGISYGDAVDGISSERYKLLAELGIHRDDLSLHIHSELKGGEHINYGVQRWPLLLIEIIEDTLKERA